MEDILQLVVAGVPVAVSVALGVQGLKVFGFVGSESAPKAAIILALLFGLGAGAIQLFPEAAPFIELGFVTFNGAMIAGLGYNYVAAPFLEKFGISVSSAALAADAKKK